MTDTQNPFLTLDEFVFNVRQHLGENYSEFWTNGEIRMWVNQACQQIADAGNFWWMDATHTITAVNGTTDYSAPPNMKSITSVKSGDSSGSEFVYVDADTFESQSFSFPVYTLYGSVLKLPSTTTGTIRVKFRKFPVKMTNPTDVSIVPMEMQDAVMFFVCAKARQKEEEFDQAKIFMQDFEDEIKRRLTAEQTRIRKSAPNIVPMRYYQ